jgi:transposase-like protein
MLYTENFKKQVVKKALSPGVIGADICRKLHISRSAFFTWKRQYAAEMQREVEEIDLAELLKEVEIDVDELLRTAGREELERKTGSTELAKHIDLIARSGKNVEAYTDRDKYAVVRVVRALAQDRRGIFLRQHGLSDRHINLWEEELMSMSKDSISNDERIQKLEVENKALKKQLAESERDKHELEVLIELKKKYHQLFKSDEDEK